MNKVNIALKEGNETVYWLELLFETEYINEQEFSSMKEDAEELVKILAAIVKTTKSNLGRN